MRSPVSPRRLSRSAVPRLAAAAALAGLVGMAQAFPTQPVRMLLGAPAGSSPDTVARLLAEAMSPLLGRPVIVDNRPGAAGAVATAAVASAAPDGHTLNASGCSGDAITHAFISQGRPPLQVFKDLTPVGRLMRDHWLVLVPPGSSAATLAALGRAAKSSIEPLAFPSLGDGSTPHLQGERLAQALGFRPLHVPYKDRPLPDLMGGRLAYAVLPSASAVPLVRTGRLKALAVLSAERLPALPEVPTAGQAGLPGYVFNGGICLWAPGPTPQAVQVRLNSTLADAARSPAVQERMQAAGADPAPYTLEETIRFVREFVAESDRLRASVFAGSR